ncbi:MAG: hypothetical protein NVSMB4_03650 [Acidimicrobiales bacterium]
MSILDSLFERRAALQEKLEALLSAAEADEKRSLTKEEDETFASLSAEIRSADERIDEVMAQQKRAAAAAEARKEFVVPEPKAPAVGGAKVEDAPVYARGNHQISYFRDLVSSRWAGDEAAAGRLRRNNEMVAGSPELRALGNTNTTGGSGGEFAPPEWIVDEWVHLARPGRVVADLFHKQDIPMGVSSVNVPKVLTGTSIALQTTQNTQLSQTDLTTGFVSTGFSTIGGKQIVSQQLLDQSAINFDAVITTDLAAEWVRQFAINIWSGAGTGANTNSVVNGLVNAVVPAGNQIAFTGTISPQALYSKSAGALAAFATNRFAQPTHWIMHPRRWFYLLSAVDNSGRPLVVPTGVAYNPLAATGDPTSVAGPVGTYLGLPVVIDPLMPTNFGTGTNQDRIYLVKADDLWLFESSPRAESFRETYSDSLGVLYRMFSYVGTVLNRQTSSIAYIDGAALVPPAF